MRRGNPIALAVIALGSMMMVIASFLPLYETGSAFSRIRHNSLIQHDGWLLVAAAVAIAVGGYFAERGSVSWSLPLVLSIATALGIVGWGGSVNERTVYPVQPNGLADYSEPGVVVPLSIAIYVAGVGVALAIVGSALLRQRRRKPGFRQPLGRQPPVGWYADPGQPGGQRYWNSEEWTGYAPGQDLINPGSSIRHLFRR